MFGEMRLQEGAYRCSCGWRESEKSKSIPVRSEVEGRQKRFAWICPDCHQVYCRDYALSENGSKIVDALLKKMTKDKIENITLSDDDGDALDETIHDLKSKEASEINNGGTREQIEYLREQGMTWPEIREAAGIKLAKKED